MKNKGFNKFLFFITTTLNSLIAFASACSFMLLSRKSLLWLLPLLIFFTLVNAVPVSPSMHGLTTRLRLLRHGRNCLAAFLGSCILSGAYHIWLGITIIHTDWLSFLFSALLCIFLLSVLFWNGIISVYCSSVQLGLKIRIIGILCGMIPIANIIALVYILRTISREISTESEKNMLNDSRAADEICRTKYPVLFVHGVFFRDFKYLNYWGRIPEELKKNGAVIFYGNHQSASSVADSGEELATRIKEICGSTGYEKVNVVAHSKGGLDIRWAASKCGAEQYIASITTINTPHRGCEFADYLLTKIPEGIQHKVAETYNAALRRLGDIKPDFLKSVWDLTASRAKEINSELESSEEGQGERIFRQSFGSRLNHATNGKFPLNFSYELVKHFGGANDGLVSEDAFDWGENYELLTVKGKRGISHGDMIDLNRENIPGFDVREFYVGIVSGLKIRGL